MENDKQGANRQTQGEGNVAADQRYRSDVQQFLRTHDVEQAARNAEPASAADKATMEEAERLARERSRGDDAKDVMKAEERVDSSKDRR